MKAFPIILILLIIPLTSAISTTLEPNYQARETIIIEIGGEILQPINTQDVELKRNNVQVPIDYDIKRLGSKYYLYLIAPQNPNNYTLYINNIQTTESGNPIIEDYSQNFEVSNGTVEYTINPGFIIATQETNEINVNLNEDFDKTITFDYPTEMDITLNPGNNIVSFDISEESEQGLQMIQLGMYTIPLMITPEAINPIPEPSLPNETTNETQAQTIYFVAAPEYIESVSLESDENIFKLGVYNPTNDNLTEITLNYNEEVLNVEPSNIDLIIPNETFEISIMPISTNEQIIETIEIIFEDYVVEIPVNLSFTTDESEVQTPSETSTLNFCRTLGGKVCTLEEKCSVDEVNSIDTNYCCTGICEATNEEGGNSWIGWLIASIVLILIVIIGARYYNTKNNNNNKFNNKIKPMPKK